MRHQREIYVVCLYGINLTLSTNNITQIGVTEKLIEMTIHEELFSETQLGPSKHPRCTFLWK